MTSQFTTEAQAKAVVEKLKFFGLDMEIFIPEYAGPFAVPTDGDKSFYHIKFSNGKAMNAGLLKEFIERFPVSWQAMIGAELYAKSIVPE